MENQLAMRHTAALKDFGFSLCQTNYENQRCLLNIIFQCGQFKPLNKLDETLLQIHKASHMVWFGVLINLIWR